MPGCIIKVLAEKVLSDKLILDGFTLGQTEH